MENNLVVKHNSIIEASYTLSIAEQRLLFACISRLDSRASHDFTKGLTISVAEAQDLFYTEKSKYNAYVDLKQASEKLFERAVRMKSDDGRYEILTRWVSTVKFDETDQTATLYFHEQIRPYITQLENKFTEYRLKHICQLSNKYAPHIYELIICWWGQNTSFKEMPISEFRELLGIGTKYKQHGQFKERIVTPVVEQINELTNMSLDISFRKSGRSFQWVQFRYNQKDCDIEQEANIFDKNVKKRIARNKKKSKLREAEEKKQRAWGASKTEEDFKKFASNCIIEVGMKFLSKNKKTYKVVNGILIFSADFKNKYHFNGQTNMLEENDIKFLLFVDDFKQITNEDDTETGDLFGSK